MARMLELIRQSAVPANLMRAAAKGALALAPAEMIEILVHLTANPVFAEQARLTLAGWDEASSLALASDPQTCPAVLDYLSNPENLRLRLLPALLENPTVPEPRMVEIAHQASREIIPMVLASTRVQTTASLLHALAGNRNLEEPDAQRVRELLAHLGEPAEAPSSDEPSEYEKVHAAEIAAEEGKPFALVSSPGDILGLGLSKKEDAAKAKEDVSTVEVLPALRAEAAQASGDPAQQKRYSTLQRIARMGVSARVQLAMKGNREERFILIRDGCKVVALAVLDSPKLAENEVEVLASMRNVQEVVLRSITLKRKFMKSYAVVKALASNPRTPLDVSLTLLPHLLLNDLKPLATNKNVPDTIRKLATKLYNQKKVAAGIR
jgi:hypothetical protein